MPNPCCKSVPCHSLVALVEPNALPTAMLITGNDMTLSWTPYLRSSRVMSLLGVGHTVIAPCRRASVLSSILTSGLPESSGRVPASAARTASLNNRTEYSFGMSASSSAYRSVTWYRSAAVTNSRAAAYCPRCCGGGCEEVEKQWHPGNRRQHGDDAADAVGDRELGNVRELRGDYEAGKGCLVWPARKLMSQGDGDGGPETLTKGNDRLRGYLVFRRIQGPVGQGKHVGDQPSFDSRKSIYGTLFSEHASPNYRLL
jgi:hypothetical protein